MIFNVTTNIVEKEASVMDLLQMQSEIHQEQMLLSMDNVSTETAITIDKVKAIIEKIKKFIKKLWKHVIITIRKKLRGEHKCVVSDDHANNIQDDWAKDQKLTCLVKNEDVLNSLSKYYEVIDNGASDVEDVIKAATGALSEIKPDVIYEFKNIEEYFYIHTLNMQILSKLLKISMNNSIQGNVLNEYTKTDPDSSTGQKFTKYAEQLQQLNTKYANTLVKSVHICIDQLPKSIPNEHNKKLIDDIAKNYYKLANILK